MKNIFGVSSEMSANQKLKNGYTMYDWVMRQKCFPAFWGRTLLGDNPITKEEIEFLKQRDCKIALIVRDFDEADICYNNGNNDAIRIMNAAKALGVPQNQGIALFIDVNPEWSIDHNWMQSYARTLYANGYVAGFIGNTDSSKNFNFDRHTSHFVQGTAGENRCGTIFCATEPKLNDMPEKWEPYCPSALNPEDIHLWACDKTSFDNFEVTDVYAQNEKVLDCMW